MMTAKVFRELALSLPGATEEPHFDRASFRVGKKIFATMTADEKEVMVKVQPMDKVEALLAAKPQVFIDFGGWTRRHGSLGVRLAKVSAPLLEELLRESYRSVAPRQKSTKARV